MKGSIEVNAVLHVETRFLFLMLVQTLALEYSRAYEKGVNVAAQVLTESMCVPQDILPSEPEKLYRWATSWVCYAYGLSAQPEWFDDNWISKDW